MPKSDLPKTHLALVISGYVANRAKDYNALWLEECMLGKSRHLLTSKDKPKDQGGVGDGEVLSPFGMSSLNAWGQRAQDHTPSSGC